MAEFFNQMNTWTFRGTVLLSLGAHVVLVLLAGIRRRQSSGLRTVALWLAYQVATWAPTYALSNRPRGATPRQQQLVAFWVPFLLMHLGGTENITAYSLEDNKLSLRQAAITVLQVSGFLFVIYNQFYIGGNGTMLWASSVMAAVGVAKYTEKALALREGDFGRIRSSSKKQVSLRMRTAWPSGRRSEHKLSEEEALLVAHDLLDVTKAAFADYSVDEDPLKRDTTGAKKLFSYGWENLCKVVEVELSLMYDILYTKAAVAHSWVGYFIRVASPAAAAAVTLIFFFYSKDGWKIEDVIITYILLTVTLLLDVAWLLGAVASAWTYAFLKATPGWLNHAALGTGRWRRLRRTAMSLDPRRLFLTSPESYRLWSGTVGQYNLLHQCTDETWSPFSRLLKKVVSEETWMEYNYSGGRRLHGSENVKELLFKHIRDALKLAYPAPPAPKPPPEPAEEKKAEKKKPAPPRPEAQFLRRRQLDEALGFVPEFQELILIWHVATDLFLLHCNSEYEDDQRLIEVVEAIKVLSDYMAFLVAVRPDMIPGLKLRSLHEVTRQALDKIWQQRKKTASSTTSRRSGTGDSSTKSTRKEEELAGILRDMEKELPGRDINNQKKDDHRSVLHGSSIILSDGTRFVEVLQTRMAVKHWDETVRALRLNEDSEKRVLFLVPELEKRTGQSLSMSTLLKLMLKSWVRVLIVVSTRCSRDAHAKQLGRGCELTTIVWILAEHAGIFRLV